MCVLHFMVPDSADGEWPNIGRDGSERRSVRLPAQQPAFEAADEGVEAGGDDGKEEQDGEDAR